MPGPAHIIEQAMQRVEQDPLLQGLGTAAHERLRQILGEAVASENESCMAALWNAAAGDDALGDDEPLRASEPFGPS